MGSPGEPTHSKTSAAAQDPSCLSSHLTVPCMLQEQSALKGDQAGGNRVKAKSAAPRPAGLRSRHEGFRAKIFMA